MTGVTGGQVIFPVQPLFDDGIIVSHGTYLRGGEFPDIGTFISDCRIGKLGSQNFESA